ncbi:MAG: UPF0104 family protein [Arenimonas sp.]
MKIAPRWLRWGASGLVLALAGWLLWRQLRGIDPALVGAALASTPPSAIASSLLATAISFGCLAVYERMATQWIAPGRVPRAVAWRIGLEAHALANTLGFHAFTGMALRLRGYRAYGIDNATLAKIVATIGGCVASGVLAILALALAWSQLQAGRVIVVVSMMLALAAAFALLHSSSRRRAIGSPVLSHAGRLLLVGLVEMGAAVTALAVLLPADVLPGGPAFVLLFVTALALGIVSHAPGGVGVFEATILAAVPAPRRAEVLAALLAYRVLYNLLPCALALLAMSCSRLRGTGLSSRADRRA